jgi:biopolymer transport protein ExbD
MAQARKKKNGEEPLELNLTPMIDVVFQLLVFFLCATKFPEPEGVLKSWLPKNKGQATSIPNIDPGSVRLVLRMAGADVTCQYEDNSSPTGFSYFSSASRYDFQTRTDEVIPRWDEVEQHLAQAKAKYRKTGVGDEGLPVIIDFGPDVPWKHVVEILNICTGLELTNLQIAAQEMPYDSG